MAPAKAGAASFFLGLVLRRSASASGSSLAGEARCWIIRRVCLLRGVSELSHTSSYSEGNSLPVSPFPVWDKV
jgi:hypothetical protein